MTPSTGRVATRVGAVALAFALVGATSPGSPAEPPRIVSSATDGLLAIEPAVSLVEVPRGATVVHRMRVANGVDATLELTLETRSVTRLGVDGPSLGGSGTTASVLALPTTELRLASGEAAVFGAVVGLGDGGTPSRLVAVRAIPRGERDAAVSALVVASRPGRRAVTVRAEPLGDDLRVVVTNPSPLHAVVRARARATTILRTVAADIAIPALVVPPRRSRRVDVELGTGLIPGPWTVEVVAAHEGEAAARATTRVVAGPLPALVATGVLLVTMVTVVVLVRRRRRSATPAGPLE